MGAKQTRKLFVAQVIRFHACAAEPLIFRILIWSETQGTQGCVVFLNIGFSANGFRQSVKIAAKGMGITMIVSRFEVYLDKIEFWGKNDRCKKFEEELENEYDVEQYQGRGFYQIWP